MDVFVINRITIENGTFEEFSFLCMMYTGMYTEKKRFLFNNIVWEKVENQDVNPSYVNPETTILSKKKHIGTKLPQGIESIVKEDSTYFPDFRKVIPIPYKVLNSPNNISFEGASKRGGVYNWCRQNWGTSINSLGCTQIEYPTFEFLTADPVPNIINKMSMANPHLTFNYEYADENTMGYGSGSYKFCNGELEKSVYPSESKEAFEILFKLRPEQQEYFELVGGTYQFKDF